MERVNQVLQDMLQMYVMDKMTKWEDYLHLIEFAYNNGKQTTLGMSLFEDIYNKKCKNPTNWGSPVNRVIVRTNMLKETK